MPKHFWEQKGSFNTLKEREDYIFKNFNGPYTLSNSYKIKNMNEIRDAIKDAIKKGLPIRIVGDYDVDGICSTTELCLYIKNLGGKDVDYYIPHRFTDGYGLSISIIERFLTNTPGILITVDNGIAAPEAFELASNMGWKTIIMDHHPATGEIAKADIIVDPNAIPCSASFTKYCAAGLVFKLAQATPELNEDIMAKITSLAALGTVCDAVPLIEASGDNFVYDNYLIVKEGLHTLLQNNGRTTGLYCLLRMLNKDISINEDDLGYLVGPVINAMSRMHDDGSDTVVKLLLMDGKDFNACDEIARILIDNNDERKEITRNIEPILIEQIEANHWENDYPIVISGNIPQGLIGPIAARISERYNTSAIVFTDGDIMHGSARTPKGTNIKEILDKCADLMISYGGHPSAAGVVIAKAKLDDFRKAMQSASGKKPGFLNYRQYEFAITPKDIKNEIDEIDLHHPYGEGHDKPIYKVENFICKKIGGKFYNILGATKETLSLNGLYAKAISFKGAVPQYEADNYPLRVNLFGSLSVNNWNGKKELQVVFEEFEKS